MDEGAAERIRSKRRHLVPRACGLLVVAALIFSFPAHAFEGPGSSPGVGSGAIGVDTSNNVSVGTSTPIADTKFFVSASSTGTGAYAVKVMQSNGGPILIIRNDGTVAIGQTIPGGASTSTFIVNGNSLIQGTLAATGAYAGTISASNVTAGVFASGNFAFPSSLGVATSSQVGLPQTLSIYGGGYFSGSVGIGTFSPSALLQLRSSAPILRITPDAGGNAVIQFGGAGSESAASITVNNTTGDITVDTSGATNPFVVAGGGNVGVGTTNPTSTLTVAGEIKSTSGGVRFPDGTVQATAASGLGGSGAANTVALFTAPTTVGNSIITQPNSATILIQNGGLGIGTTTLQSAGNIVAQGNITAVGNISAGGTVSGAYTGTVSASNVTANVFGAGNFGFPSSLGVNTSTQVGLPAPLSVYGNAYISGTVSGGTTWNGNVIGAQYGGTGQSSYNIGDVLYASGASMLARLGAVASGSAMISAGVGTAPQWGRIDLSAHTNGVLDVGKGGTGTSTQLTGVLKGNGASAFSALTGTVDLVARWTDANTLGTGKLYDNNTNVGINTTRPSSTLHVIGGISASGNISASGTIIGAYAGTIAAPNVTAGVFGAGNFGFPSSLGVNTSTQVGLPAPLSVYGNGYVSGNLGVGTANPTSTLTVAGEIKSTTGGVRFPDNTLQTTAAFGGGWTDDGTTVRLTTVSDRVGIGTAVPSSTLHVIGNASFSGNLSASGTITGSYSGTVPAGNVTAGVFGAGNFGFPSSLGVNTSTQVGLPAPLSVYGNGYISGNLAIGTTDLSDKLRVAGVIRSVTNGAGIVATDAAVSNSFYLQNDGTTAQLIYNRSGGHIAIMPTGAGNVGIGTTGPSFKLDVSGTGRFTGDVTLGDGVGTDLTVGGGAGKIDVGTVDPIYTINGEKFATYLPAMTGVKEETTGVARLKKMENGKWKMEIDFAREPKGSDLWLFSKVTQLKDRFDQMTVLLTPAFDGRVWYEKDAESQRLTIYAEILDSTFYFPDSRPEISYRLTAPRFDAEQWPNYNTDTHSSGFVIEE